MRTLPTREACLKLFERYVLLSNVRKHSIAVATLAMYIAEEVKRTKQPDLNLDIVYATSLLHDLGKVSTVAKLEPKKYGFEPLNKEELEIWNMQRSVAESVQHLFDDLARIYPSMNKKFHESDMLSILVSSLFPDFLPYVNQIGGTRDEAYFEGGTELRIMHYADWRLSTNNLVSFEDRLEYLFETYWGDQPQEKREKRKANEFALEKEIFDGLSITPDFDLDELNKKREELFPEFNVVIGKEE